MAFVRKQIKFTLRDIGSKVIDQLSSDIYSGPGSIIRELAKNAYDAYLPVDPDELEDEALPRAIVISRENNGGKGRLIIADNGVGQTLEELKANVQISISRKPDELDNATGFRGLGSWAVLGAGSKVVVTSSKKGGRKQSRLTMDVKKIYSKISPERTLDDILNDSTCILFEEQEYDQDRHGTTVEIVCDGPPNKIQDYEINRLHRYTNPTDKQLREILTQSCPLPFSAEGGAHEKIHQLYEKIGYVPTRITLDGDELERRLPVELTEVVVHDIRVGGRLAAKVWVASNPKDTGEIHHIDDARHLLGGPGIQLMRFNVPIGPKNLFSDGVVRSGILRWFVGEIHIVLEDVLPDASGQNLRAGSARELFIEAVQSFYQELEQSAETKSVRISMERKLRKGIEAAKKLEGTLSATERAHAESAIAKAVEVIRESSGTGKSVSVTGKRTKEAAKTPTVRKARAEARRIFHAGGFLQRFGSAKTHRHGAGQKQKTTPSTRNGDKPRTVNLDEFQARLGRALPRIREIGISNEQIDQLLRIITEVVNGEA